MLGAKLIHVSKMVLDGYLRLFILDRQSDGCAAQDVCAVDIDVRVGGQNAANGRDVSQVHWP